MVKFIKLEEKFRSLFNRTKAKILNSEPDNKYIDDQYVIIKALEAYIK